MKSTAQLFQTAIESDFGPALSRHGFSQTSSKAEEHGFAVQFRNGNRYVEVSGTLHPHDYPHYFSVALGDGKNEFPESDWNATALWRVLKEVAADQEAKHAGLYEIADGITPGQIDQKIKTCVALLEKYGADFLDGDLEIFRRTRALQNKTREPYKIFTPRKDGGYVAKDDDESRSLKERFSK